MENPLQTLVIPESRHEMEKVVMRMLDALEDVPGFLSLKNFFLRPFFIHSKETTGTVEQLYLGSSPNLPRECSEMCVFAALLSHMSRDEKMRHLPPLIDMLACLMPRHRRMMRDDFFKCCCNYVEAYGCAWSLVDLVPPCLKLFRKTKDTSRESVRLMANILKTIPEYLERLFRCLDPNDEDYMDPNDERFHAAGLLLKNSSRLPKFRKEKHDAVGIRETHCLMVMLSLSKGKMLSAVLIRHGFKYSFHQGYYEDCCRKLRRMRTFYFGLRMHKFGNRGNLRMQMAVEILVQILYKCRRNRELLCMLWLSRPDPFITPDELYHLMEPYFVQGSDLEDACARYRDLFPEIAPVKQPRSLKHLARVRIRESIVRANSIMEKAIRSLDIPKTLVDYLWKLNEF